MINFIKKIFGMDTAPVVVEEAKVIQKTVTKNGVGHAPKIEPVITEVKKATAKKPTAKKPAAKKPAAKKTKK